MLNNGHILMILSTVSIVQGYQSHADLSGWQPFNVFLMKVSREQHYLLNHITNVHIVSSHFMYEYLTTGNL
jgi:hypothetical protein